MTERRRPAIWSPEAITDLEAIWDYYTRAAGTPTAEKLVREIAALVENIEQHPMIGRARDELRAGLRLMAASPHVVFYRVIDNIPAVVRVLDGRQDIDEIFSE
ncbi:MAG: type II toxin-antitoxin system RelE/ParE family toxin [Xanthobacteraceae bacterium]|nr:type II toxin-antitoxin system RelE/ParE family toxin [Xanthobacteraceae bacterium]